MFVHQHSLRHLLRPEHYCSATHFAREIDELFQPAWHFVAAKSEMPRDGDFRTLELFGHPILLRNCGGEFRAFENICSHRHCLLTDQPHGNSPSLRCRYHGWEYDQDGRTAKIPDARCFRPWDRDHSRLRLFRLESCGDLLFATCNDHAPSLRDWLDPFFEETEDAFRPGIWKLRYVWEYDCDCNWKVPVENTLESYHLQALHQESFGGFLPGETESDHQLDSRYTALTYHAPASSRIEQWQGKISSWLGRKPALRYLHRHIHPHTILVSTDTINYALMYRPTSPTTVQVRVRLYGLRGTARGPLASFISWITWRIDIRQTFIIHNEDRSIYSAQQKGLQASRHPGVIGTREERIYIFQKYILESLGLPLPDDPANSEATVAAADVPVKPVSS